MSTESQATEPITLYPVSREAVNRECEKGKRGCREECIYNVDFRSSKGELCAITKEGKLLHTLYTSTPDGSGGIADEDGKPGTLFVKVR